jgi:hypothetical protein
LYLHYYFAFPASPEAKAIRLEDPSPINRAGTRCMPIINLLQQVWL